MSYLLQEGDTPIALADCQVGGVYRLRSRNLAFGIFDGKRGFVGIRTKFYSRFLDTEYHVDAPPFNTATPIELVGFIDETLTPEALLAWCKTCGKSANFDMSRGETVTDRWQHDEPADHDVDLIRMSNAQLFPLLDAYERDLAEQQLDDERLNALDERLIFELSGELNPVDANTYFEAQRRAGQSPGPWSFRCVDGSGGRVSNQRMRQRQ